ncbi:MAG: hypothetical protein V7744_03575 [Pseudomonadales bacterium]
MNIKLRGKLVWTIERGISAIADKTIGHLPQIRRRKKIFCIGLHKTGTTSLCWMGGKLGYKAVHSTDWAKSSIKIFKFDFFSDGGSHFDGINEFDFERWFYRYPNALFILQTRETERWVVSKLMHAGWKEGTAIEPDDEEKIRHQDWRYKSLLTIRKFIEHKYSYEKRVVDFFEKHGADRLLVVDVTNRSIQSSEINRMLEFLDSECELEFPQLNKAGSGVKLSGEVESCIERTISICRENNA